MYYKGSPVDSLLLMHGLGGSIYAALLLQLIPQARRLFPQLNLSPFTSYDQTKENKVYECYKKIYIGPFTSKCANISYLS